VNRRSVLGAVAVLTAAVVALPPSIAHADPVNKYAESHMCEGITQCGVWEDVVVFEWAYDVGAPYVKKTRLDCHPDHTYGGYTIHETWCGTWNDGGRIPNQYGRQPYMSAGDDFDMCWGPTNCKHFWQRINADVYGHFWRTSSTGPGS
jgi:hypothetical protein